MHKKLVNFVKYNKFFLALYRFFGAIFISILSIFVRTNKKRILFVSFGGQKYDDSPKELYLRIKDDPYFKDYELVWAFHDPGKFDLDCKKVKIDTIKFYIMALSSKIWINNSSVERGLKFRRKSTIEINTWHGTPLKKMGADIHENHSFKNEGAKKGLQIYCAQSEYDQEIFERLFNVSKENILISDLPRNDSLTRYTEEEKEKIKNALEIPPNKKVILYAPTYREYNRDSMNNCYIKPPINFEKWKEKLGNEYVLLFRAHYEVAKVLGLENSNDFVYNVSSYPSLNDLMVISDLVISDYSSIYFDYSILEKPMFNFSYDYEEYCRVRGLYFDIKEEMGCNINLDEDSLIEEILTFDEEEYCKNTIKFKNKYAPKAGHAGDIVIDKIKKIINS